MSCDVYNGGRVREACRPGDGSFVSKAGLAFMLPAVGMPCVSVVEENEGAVQLARNPNTNSNCKYIDVRHQLLRELQDKNIPVIHVPFPMQHAHFMTKSIAEDSIEFHRSLAIFLGGV